MCSILNGLDSIDLLLTKLKTVFEIQFISSVVSIEEFISRKTIEKA